LLRLLFLLLLLLLQLLFLGQMVPDHATGGGAKHRVVARDVAGDRADGRSLDAALRRYVLRSSQ
jgi:hypothetical protein